MFVRSSASPSKSRSLFAKSCVTRIPQYLQVIKMTRLRDISRTLRGTRPPQGAGLQLQASANWKVALTGGIQVRNASDLRLLLLRHPCYWTPLETAGWVAAPLENGGGGCPELYWLLEDRLISGQALLDIRKRECESLGITDPELQSRFMQSIEVLLKRSTKARVFF